MQFSGPVRSARPWPAFWPWWQRDSGRWLTLRTPEGGDQLEEITVTGSRIKRSTDFDTANPTTVVDSTYMQNLNVVNVGDMVKQLPANLSNNTPRTTGNANFFIGSTIANLRGLNPYFGSRTLSLVDNRRFVPTNQGDGVDLNFIPSILIDHVDIVTGGASAAYGSGAIAGVQNIFLNRKLEGGKAQIDYGKTGEGDGAEKHVGVAFGSSVLDGRGHFVVGYEYQDSDAVGCINARDWCREGNGFYNTDAGYACQHDPAVHAGSRCARESAQHDGRVLPEPCGSHPDAAGQRGRHRHHAVQSRHR